MAEDRNDTPDGNNPDGRSDVEPESVGGEPDVNSAGYNETALLTSPPVKREPNSQEADGIPPSDSHDDDLIDERYRLHERIGEGGMGSVFRATHVLMDKPVAVKLIHGELAHLPEVAKRFEREARSASRLSNPHCITVTDFGRTEYGTLYLVMELLDGESLNARLKREHRLSVEKVFDIAKQILKGLSHAHEAGVVHRDLKPENVMLVDHGDETDFAKVFDFGIAKLASGAGSAENLTQSGLIVGTPAYLSPEQALGEDADHRVDLYAVGVMLYEMLAGVRPFSGESAMDIVSAHLTSPIPPLPEADRFPEGIQEVIERAMAKKPSDRFESAAEFLAALEAIELDTQAKPSPVFSSITEGSKQITSFYDSVISPRLKKIVGILRDGLERLAPRTRRLVVGFFVMFGIVLITTVVLLIFQDDKEKLKGSTPLEVVVSRLIDKTDNDDEDKVKEMFERADAQIRVGLPNEAKVTVKEALRLSPKQPIGHLFLGHAEFLTGDRSDAMKSYGRALAIDEDLAEDVRLREHLEEGLKWDASRDQAARILAEFGGDEGIELLTSRANSALPNGEERQAARMALIAVSKKDHIDWIASLTADFNEFKTCKKRKKIIAQMEKTGDPGFLPLLKAHEPRKKKRKRKNPFRGFRDAFRKDKTNQCIAADLKRAIKTLTAIKEGKGSAS
ncbi:MAG: protein kinase [Proteobacteria bacterium]|nr:protein kinase [Pseudomonadota bacterium]